MLGFPSTFEETKTETGSGLHRGLWVGEPETKRRCAGLARGLSAAEKQGAGSKLTDNLRMGVGVG